METAPVIKDYVDIKIQYRRLKIEEQCRKLNPKVSIPSRSSWRDRMNGNIAPTNVETIDITKKTESPSARRKKLSLELRRTAVYYVDRSIDVDNFKIIDKMHLKRSQIEARLAEYNQKKKTMDEPILMLTYPGFEKLTIPPVIENKLNTEESDDIILDGLGLKNNTNRKKSIFNEFTKNTSDAKIIKKSEPPQAKKKNYSTSADWREELKNRDKAKQIEAMAGYTIGMPGYKEPEEKLEEPPAVVPVENKWAKTGKNWEKINLKPSTKHVDLVQEKKKKENEPFKISLKKVGDRNIARNNEVKDSKSLGEVKDSKKKEQPHLKSMLKSNKTNEKQPKENIKSTKSENIVKVTVSSSDEKENIKLSKEKDENKKKVNNHKKLNSSRTKYQHETSEKKYVIKIINFVAIKVAVDEEPAPAKRRRSVVKKMDEKPPCPVDKPPSLPKEEIIEDLKEYKLKESKEEEVDAQFLDVSIIKDETPKEENIHIEEEPKLNVVTITIPLVHSFPKKAKEEKSYDEKYFKPRRKRMIDYIPEPLPKRMIRDDAEVVPMKFSTVTDNCVTKTLFVGSQYVGSGGQKKA